MSYQKFIYILCQSQTFCARTKDDLHSVKLVFSAGILGNVKGQGINSLAGIGSWSACKHYNKDLSKNRKASQPWLPSQESYAFLAPSVFSHISEFLPWIKMNSRDVSTVVFYALSFYYRSKMILDRPNDFGQVPGWMSQICFGQVQILLERSKS